MKIVEFAAFAPKVYALKYNKPDKSGDEVKIKAKGIPMNLSNLRRMGFNELCFTVFQNYISQDPHVLPQAISAHLEYFNLTLDTLNSYNTADGVRKVVGVDKKRTLGLTFNKRVPVRLLKAPDGTPFDEYELVHMWECKQLDQLVTVPFGYKNYEISDTKTVEEYDDDEYYKLSVLAYGDEVFDVTRKEVYDEAYNMQAIGDKRPLADIEDELLQNKRNRANPLEEDESFGDDWGSEISFSEPPSELDTIPM